MLFESAMSTILTSIGTGIGVAVGTWFFKRYLEPTLDKHHETLAKIKISEATEPKDPDLIRW